MATSRKVPQTIRAAKKHAEKPLPKGRIEAAAKRASIKRRPDPDELFAFSRCILESFDIQLRAAQELAIQGSISPRYLDGGPVKAVEAFQMIGHIRRDIARALQGGAS